MPRVAHRLALLVPAIALAFAPTACSRRDAAPPAASQRYGEVMREVGARFERAGRAAAASRWELAEYDVGELGEAFDDDLPHATPPKEVKIDLAPMAKGISAPAAALKRAAAARDRAAFENAFADCARACNACHAASGHAFIEVPARVGAEVPAIAASASASAAGTPR